MLAGFVGEGLSLSLILSCGRAVESPRLSYVSREGLPSGPTPLPMVGILVGKSGGFPIQPAADFLLGWALERPLGVPPPPIPLRPARHHPPPHPTELQTLFGEFVAGQPHDVTRMECK